ncbi:hypothetical protein BHU72_01890 [Desulfuribacillus stibiiarsenatis]|uniref:Nuclease SbcCD subunit C n=1 Tax=Desulfuribacillus stibiiarsenatis TaxID=1390249 RepID=A0A1E5L683_9FIRM|nr:AAA family ATPase [Desulfuribacillus stibiiarsenatis]OEH85574.1 hypothetical protein BHU72_01890 [Desulfuribacillus stibiiarsenatis]
MNKKIKEVNIEAFRAYENLQNFDFVHKESGNVADLVVIYAPNGYGKTSFFDAIEWAVTDEIGRFKSTKAIKQEVDSEKGDILKNRKSNALQGSVQIVSESDSVFEKKTKKRTGNMKSDYKPGDLEAIPHELQGILDEKNTFCTTNMLAHDKITNFLHSYTAEDKTKALQIFWDTSGYSEILDRIYDLYDEIMKKEKSLHREIQKEESDFKEYKYESVKEQDVYRLIDSFNADNNDFIIEHENIVENIDKVLEKTYSILRKIQECKDQNETLLNSIELLISDYPNYLLNKTNFEVYKNEKKELENKQKFLNFIEKLLIRRKKIQGEINELLEVINNWHIFLNIEGEVVDKKNLKKQLEDAKPELQKRVIEVKDIIIKCKENVSGHSKTIEKELVRKRNLEIDFKKYNENKINLKKYSNFLTKATFVLDQRVEKRKILSYEISNIESFIGNKCSIDHIKDFLSREILDSNTRLTSQKNEKSVNEEKIQLLEQKYNNTVLLQNKINQLLIQGKEFVDITKTCECPLCHAKYEDYSTLISRITADYEDNSEVEYIKKELEATKKINNMVIENIVIESENLRKLLEEILEDKKIVFSRHNERIHRLQLQINDWNNISDNLMNENEGIQKLYKEININIQDAEAITLLKAEIYKNVVDISSKIEEEESRIAADLDLLNNLETTLKENELKNIELSGEIFELNNNNSYNSILLFLENKKLRDENNDLESALKNIVHVKNNLVEEMLLTDSELINLQNKVKGTNEEIALKFNSILIKIQESLVVTDSYRLRLKKVFEVGDIESIDNYEKIDERKSKLTKRNNILKQNISLLQSILSNVKNLKEHNIWITKKKENDRKKRKLDSIRVKIKNLEESKNIVESHIVTLTNAYFKSNTINEIYHKIDPHPTMNHIKFLTKRSDKGLQTNIYTYDKDEEEQISPILYLSSAQINILSLCIFLAKVLTERNTTFSTIFMDDPIQHLDGINLLSFIDLLRTITTTMGRQIVISTHNEHFYNLIRVKMDERYYMSRFIELNGVGEICNKII